MKHFALVLVLLLAIVDVALAGPPMLLIGDYPDQVAIKQIVSQHVLENTRYKNKQFRSVQIEVIHKKGHKYLLIYLIYQNEYLFETAIVTLNHADNAVQRVEVNVNTARIEQLKPVAVNP